MTQPLTDSVGRMPRRANSAWKRQKPTRIPYSCQAQFGTSGSSAAPVGGDSTWRGMGFSMSQVSTLTTGQTIRRAPPGPVWRGRSEGAV